MVKILITFYHINMNWTSDIIYQSFHKYVYGRNMLFEHQKYDFLVLPIFLHHLKLQLKPLLFW